MTPRTPQPPSDPRGSRLPLANREQREEFSLVDDLDQDQEADPDLKKAIRAHSNRRDQRRRARLERPIMALPLTPLIDVVFQLLVFFLLVTDFSGPEEIFRVDLPEPVAAMGQDAGDSGGTTRDPFTLDRQPVRVLVTSTGPGLDAGSRPGAGAQGADYHVEVVGVNEEIAGFDHLEAILRRNLADPATRRGLYLPDHPVVLEPSPATSWEHSVGAFNAIVRAGYNNVVFKGMR